MRLTGLLAICAALVTVVLGYRSHLESKILRTDPNRLTEDAASMRFANGPGEMLFKSHCTICHGPSGEGNSKRGIPSLRDGDWLYGTGRVSDIEQVIAYGIRSHHPKGWNLAIMPAYATPVPSDRNTAIAPLSPRDIADVVDFLMRAQGRPSDRAAAARGAQLFAGRGGCYDCHSPDAKGDSAIGAPNLTDVISLYGDGTREALFTSIAYGRQGVCPSWINRISPLRIREIALYVYSLSHAGSQAYADR